VDARKSLSHRKRAFESDVAEHRSAHLMHAMAVAP